MKKKLINTSIIITIIANIIVSIGAIVQSYFATKKVENLETKISQIVAGEIIGGDKIINGFEYKEIEELKDQIKQDIDGKYLQTESFLLFLSKFENWVDSLQESLNSK